MINKVSKNLETDENIVEQTKNTIKNLDKRITKVQNSYTCLLDLYHTTVAVARSAANAVQAQTLQVSVKPDYRKSSSRRKGPDDRSNPIRY